MRLHMPALLLVSPLLAGAKMIDLYRGYKNGDHFYTTSKAERDNAGFADEGSTCRVSDTRLPGTQA